MNTIDRPTPAAIAVRRATAPRACPASSIALIEAATKYRYGEV